MSDIDEELTELLKGKAVKNVQVSAFPDIFIEFEDGTMLSYEFEDLISSRTDGDEKNLKIRLSNSYENVFEDEIKKVFNLRGNWEQRR